MSANIISIICSYKNNSYRHVLNNIVNMFENVSI